MATINLILVICFTKFVFAFKIRKRCSLEFVLRKNAKFIRQHSWPSHFLVKLQTLQMKENSIGVILQEALQNFSNQFCFKQHVTASKYVMRCAIWYHWYNLKSVKNTHGGVLILVKLQALACNFTRINAPSWVFFTFLKLYKWYQIAQWTTYKIKFTLVYWISILTWYTACILWRFIATDVLDIQMIYIAEKVLGDAHF